MEIRRLSSRWTPFCKKAFPVAICGVVAITLMMALVAMRTGKQGAWMFLVLPLLMMVVGYFVYRHLIVDLADEVRLEGEATVVKHRDASAEIPRCGVTDVEASTMTNRRRITLTLRNESRRDRGIVFMPAVASVSLAYRFKPDPVATELAGRIDALRTSAS